LLLNFFHLSNFFFFKFIHWRNVKYIIASYKHFRKHSKLLINYIFKDRIKATINTFKNTKQFITRLKFYSYLLTLDLLNKRASHFKIN